MDPKELLTKLVDLHLEEDQAVTRWKKSLEAWIEEATDEVIQDFTSNVVDFAEANEYSIDELDKQEEEILLYYALMLHSAGKFTRKILRNLPTNYLSFAQNNDNVPGRQQGT